MAPKVEFVSQDVLGVLSVSPIGSFRPLAHASSKSELKPNTHQEIHLGVHLHVHK